LIVRREQGLDRVVQARITGASLGEKGGTLCPFVFQRGVEESFFRG
jgi:hypothetical protein